jgi:hypothetical protein
VKRYSEIITEELTLAENEDTEPASSEELISSSPTNRFQQRPASLSEFLRLHGVPHTVLSNGTSPGVASDPRSLVNHHMMMSQNSSNRGIIRQRDPPSELTSGGDEDDDSNGQRMSTLNYRVIRNPSIRFISTNNGNTESSNENHRPRVIQFRSSSQGGGGGGGGDSGSNSVRVISYPHSGNRDSRNDSSTPTPVTYILRHVPNSHGSGYVPIAVRHRNLPLSDEDSDDGL